MASTDTPEPSSAIPLETRARIERLAASLLERYHIHEPPVPIELMLQDPLLDLWEADLTQVSSIIGHGLYRYAPRLAQARLLYRTISESPEARREGLDAPWPASRREVKYFARCLLMPEDWIRCLPQADRTPEGLCEIFHVPSFDAIVRLAELGLPVPGGTQIDPNAQTR